MVIEKLGRQVSENMRSPPAGNKKNGSHYNIPPESASILRKILSEKRAKTESSSFSAGHGHGNGNGELPTDCILKMARERLVLHQRENFEVASTLVDGLIFDTTNSSLSPKQCDDLELALFLQAAALKFSCGQFDRAKALLSLCQSSASPSGNALHRIVSYFSAALQERVARELGEQFVSDAALEGNVSKLANKNSTGTNLQVEMIKSYQLLPFCQVTDLTGIQAIVDNVGSAKRIHLIDLGIRSASQWPILMQALGARRDCPVLELLKLTAIGEPEDNEIGKVLSSLAQSMNIPFEFKLIVSDLKDLREDLFESSSDDDEAVAVYSELRLASLLPSPDQLASVLGAIEKLNPRVMVVIEIEASTDTPIFMNRFDAALTVCAAVFDCLEGCLERDDPCRASVEGGFVWGGIRNVITAEDEERVCRHEKLDFWRGLMSRFGGVELALSDAAFCQLDLVVKSNPRWGSCTAEVNGKGIVVGWRGSPIKSLSVWNFHHHG